MLDIDTAIKHCLEVAEQNEISAITYKNCKEIKTNMYEKLTAEKAENECRECAADHRQLAEWLTELKELREKEQAKWKDNKSLCLVWQAMKNRCDNPKSERYKDYGARGIKVCSEWQEREKFTIWAINNGYKKGLQLDRIDNNGNYEPNNCRWVTPKQNSRNRRNTIRLFINGKEWYIPDLCRMLNLYPRTVYNWVERHGKQYAENRIEKIFIGGSKNG